MYKTSRKETPFDASIPKRPGWEGMHVHWLADREHGETETTVLNVTEFPPNRWHELHGHPHAEEYFYVLEGEGLHLTDGEPIRLREGDLVFIPKGEWHGFANDSSDPTLAVTVMGAASRTTATPATRCIPLSRRKSPKERSDDRTKGRHRRRARHVR